MRRREVRTAGALGLVMLLGTGCAAVSGGGATPEMAPASPTMDAAVASTGYRNGASYAESVRVVQALPGSMAEPAEEKIAFHSGEGDEMGPPPSPPPPPPKPAPAQPGAPPPVVTTPPATPTPASEVAVVRGPLLVYTAQITMSVFEVNASLAQVEVIGKELGGFLAKRDDSSITIRVPVAKFEDAVKRIEKVGDMLHRNVTAEDVTEEFRDLEVRLRSARAVQERLTQLLAKAAKVEESVLIEKELDRVSGEIDRVEGRMKFLRDRAAYSTITVGFQAKPKDMGPSGPFRLPGRWLYELGLGRLLRL
ncbi:MAG: DUF4349 domain-containing protein [Byssovorax sp.]